MRREDFGTIIEIGDVLVSEDVVCEFFACDYPVCKGACCIVGDSGAPLEEEEIPALAACYETLMKAHRALWESNSKRQGWEVLALRYGGAIGRLQDTAEELERFTAGQLACIPELEEVELPDGKGFFYDRVSTPSAKT